MNTTALKARTAEAIRALRERIANRTITGYDFMSLHYDRGLDIGGVRCWLVDAQIRTFTQCTECDTYWEEAVELVRIDSLDHLAELMGDNATTDDAATFVLRSLTNDHITWVTSMSGGCWTGTQQQWDDLINGIVGRVNA